MALIDLVEWSPQSNDIFAYRFPHSNLSTATQLIVRESQEAVFFSKGQIIGKFGPGKHKLTTENLPLLRNLYGIPFGGKNPFTAEVWFVNKTAPLTIDWKTTTMRYMDPDYNASVPLVAQGRYGLKVKEAEKFLIKLVGTLQTYTSRELTNHFMGPLIAKTNSSLMSYMTANHIGINQISGYLDDLSNFIGRPMAEFWEGYGFNLEGFYITSIDIDTSTSDGQKISEAMSDRSAQGIAGYTWQQKQSFDVANNAVVSGTNMGIVGVGMMMGGLGGNGMGASMMQPIHPGMYGMQQGMGYGMQSGMDYGMQRQSIREVFCSRCSKKFSTDNKFCPHCGKKYSPCPACGYDNDEKETRCVKCGTHLVNDMYEAGTICSTCGLSAKPGLKFCPQCGNKL